MNNSFREFRDARTIRRKNYALQELRHQIITQRNNLRQANIMPRKCCTMHWGSATTGHLIDGRCAIVDLLHPSLLRRSASTVDNKTCSTIHSLVVHEDGACNANRLVLTSVRRQQQQQVFWLKLDCL